MDDAPRSGRVQYALLAIAMALLLVVGVGATDASAKGKKVHACVIKRGPEKGLMRFSPKGKCHRGEKKVAWNKQGKAGPAGAAGQQGPRGEQGPSGVTDQLLNTISQQQAKIDQLTQQVAGLTSALNGLSPQVAALCTQMSAVTSQTNALGTALGGLTVNNVLAMLGGALNIPSLPAALAPFTCP